MAEPFFGSSVLCRVRFFRPMGAVFFNLCLPFVLLSSATASAVSLWLVGHTIQSVPAAAGRMESLFPVPPGRRPRRP